MSSEFRHRASLVLNVVLAVAAVVLAFPKSDPPPVAPAMEATPKERQVFIRQPRPRSLRYPETASSTDQRRWLVDQLRAMGVPNHVLARIALKSIDVEYNQRSVELIWDDAALDALQLEKDSGMDSEMRAALGEENYKQWDQANMLREALPITVELTGSEADALYDLKKKRQRREYELREALMKGEIDEADLKDAFAKANAELTEQMKSLLGEQRYAKSQGMDDEAAAADLQQEYAKANLSESQFQELLKTQQQANEQRAALDPSSPNYSDQLKALDAARDQEYRRVLGPGVFDAVQKEHDGAYAAMKKYEKLWGLDGNTIDSVYGSMKYYEKSVQDYKAQARALEAEGKSVDWEAVNKNLQQFKQQTQQSLQNYLGDDRFKKMKENGVFYQFTPSSRDDQ